MAFLLLDRFSEGKCPLKQAKIKYLLFDIEGVIIDSVGAQFEAFRQAVMTFGTLKANDKTARQIFLERMAHLKDTEPKKFERFDDFTIEHYHALISGRSREGGLRNLLDLPREEEATPEENELIDALGKEKDRIFQKMLEGGQIHAFPAVADMLTTLHRMGIPMAFASGSSNAAMMLYQAKLLDKFRVGVLKGRDAPSGQKGKYVVLRNTQIKLPEGTVEIPSELLKIANPQFHGKPMPWIFHKAAWELGKHLRQIISGFECAVFEDSPQVVGENYEESFGAVVGVDTGNAFNRELVRAGNVIYCKPGQTPEQVAANFRELILSRLAIPAHLIAQRDDKAGSAYPAARGLTLFGGFSTAATSAAAAYPEDSRESVVPARGHGGGGGK